ncbi:MAG: RNA methyltransferase [Candidatus Saccharibacteria bacterium]|nr:RNA methyltransferase [Candidatus Saccharibacteria bacterium]
MEIIRSRQNAKIKQIVRLITDAKARRQTGITVIDGVSFVRDYIAKFGQPEMLLIDETKQERAQAVLELASDYILVSPEVMKLVSSVKTNAGVLAVVKIPNTKEYVDRGQSVLLIDRVQDPGNLGAICRLALAVGIDDILLADGSVDPFSPNVIRSSAGAVFNLNIYQKANLMNFIKQHSKMNFIATSSHAEKNIFELDLTSQIGWLVGNEGAGVSPVLLKLATLTTKIPQSEQLESLNLAMATTVCLYEQFRQNNL